MKAWTLGVSTEIRRESTWVVLGLTAGMLLALPACSPGPSGQAWVAFKQQQADEPQTKGPASAVQAGRVTPPNEVASGESVDEQVQRFVARFPGEDRGAAVAPAGTTGNLAGAGQGGSGVNAAPPPPPQPSVQAVAPVANPTGIQPMRAVQTSPVGSPTATGADVQASPSPPKVVPPLAEPTIHAPRVELIDVRPVTAAAVLVTKDSVPANQPVQNAAVAKPADLGALMNELETRVQSGPDQLDDLLKLRLLYLATGQDDKAVVPVAVADPVQGELLSALFRLVAASRGVTQRPMPSPASALLAADELRRLLAQQTPVMIPKIALVTRVNSFGDYEAVDPPRFPAGAGVHVFLYTEVANFRSVPTQDGRLRTLLSEKVEIYDGTGKVVHQESADDIEDRVFSPRRDFFIPMEIRLPANTPSGEYVLKVTIEDKLGATTDQQRLTFSIGP